MATEVGALSSASAEIDPGFTIVGPHSGTLFISPLSSVPEPTTCAVLTLGMFGIGSLIRRRRVAQVA